MEKIAGVLTLTSLLFCNYAEAAVEAARPPVCRYGVWLDPATGKPVLGPDRRPIDCEAPDAELGAEVTAAAAAVASAGVGLSLALRHHGQKHVPLPPLYPLSP